MAIALSLTDCRCRTTSNGAVTRQCNELADVEYRKALVDGGAKVDPLLHKNICEGCCYEHGLTGVEPGPCVCGELGVDVIFK